MAHIIWWKQQTRKQCCSSNEGYNCRYCLFRFPSPLKEKAERKQANSEMAVSSACFQVPTLLQIASSRKQLLQTHRYNRSSRPERHDRATLLHKCFSQRQSQSNSTQKEKEQFEYERLFSNLNQATLKREPGFPIAIIFFFLFYEDPLC